MTQNEVSQLASQLGELRGLIVGIKEQAQRTHDDLREHAKRTDTRLSAVETHVQNLRIEAGKRGLLWGLVGGIVTTAAGFLIKLKVF